ncbi:MAG TPA: extracellular solute-binding protein [Roseiflexaceae bacterium]|nr:extracellular solute-binding protein [Roseiflexaceae bacterium]
MKVGQIPWLRAIPALALAVALSACGGAPAPSGTASTAAPAQPTAAPQATAATSTEPTAAPATEAPTSAPATGAADPLPAVVTMPAQIAGGRPVEITVVGKPPESQPESLKSWTEQVQRFQERYPNVTVNGSDYAYAPDTFATLVAGKQVPTLFEVYLSDPSKIIDQGIAADLSSFFDAHKLRDVFNPNILSITSKDGKVYGIPRFAYAMGLAYNIPLLKEAGYDAPPRTWEELATMAQKLTNREQARAGFSFINDGSNATGWQFTTLAYTWGAKQSNIVTPQADGKYTAGFAEGAPIEALSFVKELRWTYDVLPRENLDWAMNGEALATGRSAMAVLAGDQFTWIRMTYPDVDISQFGYAALPAGPNGKSVSLVGGNIAMISSDANADQQEAAVYYRLFTQFDPAEIQLGYENSTKDPTVVVGAPTLPLYVGSYQEAAQALQNRYANLPTANYSPFTDAVTSGQVALEPEPATAGQEYYGAVGAVVSSVLTDQAVEPAPALSQAATTFQTNVLDQLK